MHVSTAAVDDVGVYESCICVDSCFVDRRGTWRHHTSPSRRLSALPSSPLPASPPSGLQWAGVLLCFGRVWARLKLVLSFPVAFGFFFVSRLSFVSVLSSSHTHIYSIPTITNSSGVQLLTVVEYKCFVLAGIHVLRNNLPLPNPTPTVVRWSPITNLCPPTHQRTTLRSTRRAARLPIADDAHHQFNKHLVHAASRACGLPLVDIHPFAAPSLALSILL